MRASEVLVLAYFVYLAVASLTRPMPTSRRVRVAGWALVLAAAVASLPRWGHSVVRDWAPAAGILAAYFLTGLTFAHPNLRMEAWLESWDRRVLGEPAARQFLGWPAPIVVGLHVVYMLCFLLVPAGFALLLAGGYGSLADRYWTTVVAAELGAFAPLPFLQTRPPWAVEPPVGRSGGIHWLSAIFVRHATIGANTFPSGHVAGSLAVALAVAGPLPLAGALLGVAAVAIALACVVGRYHYVVDVAAGAALAVVVWAASARWVI